MDAITSSGLASSEAQPTEEGEKNAAVRSYLNATITPALLKALVAMEKENPERPVVWLANYLNEHFD